jgi:membrane glycosyltransferase
VDGPYRGSGPIYVREQARPANLAAGEVPDLLRRRLLSLRAYDAAGMLRASEVIEGRELAALVAGMFADPDVAYLHAHNARPGCYNCRIDRSAG